REPAAWTRLLAKEKAPTYADMRAPRTRERANARTQRTRERLVPVILATMAQAVSPASTTPITVRDVRGADELRACQELQRRAWGITEDGYILPVATMAGAQRAGGLLLGAFDANTNAPNGFAFPLLGQL